MTVNWTCLKSEIEPLALQIFQLKQYNGLVKTEEDNRTHYEYVKNINFELNNDYSMKGS